MTRYSVPVKQTVVSTSSVTVEAEDEESAAEAAPKAATNCDWEVQSTDVTVDDDAEIEEAVDSDEADSEE